MERAFVSVLDNTTDCTGCGACAAVCPNNSISMKFDNEGFITPDIDIKNCTECGLCRNTCPINHFYDKKHLVSNETEPLFVYAAWNLDETVRRLSSSGGIFSILAENVLNRHGLVVGAALDKNLVVQHIAVETNGELACLRGSKYVQSEISMELYHYIRDVLLQGRYVLFSGTPCQTAGLKAFLGGDCKTLFCCDIICHGTPSPLLWKKYTDYHVDKGNILVNASFRDKKKGWKKFGICFITENGHSLYSTMDSDPYLIAFLHDYALRDSCYACRFTSIHREGDLTIADFWGVTKKYSEYDDDKGTSLVLVNSKKGEILIDQCKSGLFLGQADIKTAIAGNSMLCCSARRPIERDSFYKDLVEYSFIDTIKRYRLYGPSPGKRILSVIKRIIIKMFSIINIKKISSEENK